MSFPTVRRTLFTIHMWVGLILGLFLAVLGLSGSILVYDDKIADFFAAPPRAIVQGHALPLAMVVGAARRAAGERAEGAQAQIMLPQEAGDAVMVRFTRVAPPPGERREVAAPSGERRARAVGPRPGGGVQVYIDPVSGQVLGTRKAGLLPAFAFLHQLHGSFKMGRDVGRPFVGWLGVAMLALGVSGLVLWWPRRGQWKYAFFVRKTATGLRFHRELHSATGIWIFLVFMAVSFSGVAISFPQSVRALIAPTSPAPKPAFNLREGPRVEPVESGRHVGPDEAIRIAQRAMPGMALRSVSLPARLTQAIGVGFVSAAGTTAMAYINPYDGAVIATRDPAKVPGAESFMAFQRPVHDGSGFGPVWRFLVFLSGLVPALFVFTGVTMWLKKRRKHVPMTAPLEDEAVS